MNAVKGMYANGRIELLETPIFQEPVDRRSCLFFCFSYRFEVFSGSYRPGISRVCQYLEQHPAGSRRLSLLRQAQDTCARNLEIPQKRWCIFQPAATPEVNPIERVWQYLTDRIAVKHFAALDDWFHAVSAILTGLLRETRQSLAGFDDFITAVKGAFI